MASSLVVAVVKIGNVREHPQAAFLAITEILGYQMVVPLVEDPNGSIVRYFQKGKLDKKGKRIPACAGGSAEKVDDQTKFDRVTFSFRFKPGDKAVYFPADTILTDEWAEKFGVKNYLQGENKDRVGRTLLRGEPSFGILVALPEGEDWPIGMNVADYYNAKKYEPPARETAPDAEAYDSNIDPYFQKYTDIENGRIFTSVINPGEEVIITEKIDGRNCRTGTLSGIEISASMTLRRLRPEAAPDGKSLYWFPHSLASVQALIKELQSIAANSMVVGELFGRETQSGQHYDVDIGYCAFDICVNGKYLDYDEYEALCGRFGVPTAPVLYRGPFDLAMAKNLADGPSKLSPNFPREGVVVRLSRERNCPETGRVILKFVGTKYELNRKSDFRDI